jgi:hypothetical protein
MKTISRMTLTKGARWAFGAQVVLGAALALRAGAALEVVAVNGLDRARVSETIKVQAKDLAGLGVKDLWMVRVKDEKGTELPLQATDNDGDSLRTLGHAESAL